MELTDEAFSTVRLELVSVAVGEPERMDTSTLSVMGM